MNINTLERVARQTLKGEKIDEKNIVMLTPAEHKSLKSLSSQIAANVQFNNGAAAGAVVWDKTWGDGYWR